jgi:hypothetical protein
VVNSVRLCCFDPLGRFFRTLELFEDAYVVWFCMRMVGERYNCSVHTCANYRNTLKESCHTFPTNKKL